MITGAQCRAGRALAELSREILSRLSDVGEDVIWRFERKLDTPDDAVVARIAKGLEEAGIVFLAENGGGVGVRLKFNASETKRLAVLESEGGRAALDDVQ